MKLSYCCVGLLYMLIPLHSNAVQPNTMVATLQAGLNPFGIAITPDNKYAYVANNNRFFIGGGDTVSVLDLVNRGLYASITLPQFSQATWVVLNPTATKLYVVNFNTSTISIIDTSTNTIIGTITGFDGPYTMAITPDGNYAYVSNFGSIRGVGRGNGKFIRVVDLVNNVIVGDPITVATAPTAVTISPDGSHVYVASFGDGTPKGGAVTVINTADNTVSNTITGFFGPFSIAIPSNGKYAYVTNAGKKDFTGIGTTVSVIDLSNNTITATIPMGIQPTGIAITPDQLYAYVTNFNMVWSNDGFNHIRPGQGFVQIIDLSTNTVVNPAIRVGESPCHIVIPSTGEYAYITNANYNSVSVLALQPFTIIATASLSKTEDSFVGWMSTLNISAKGSFLPVKYLVYNDANLIEFQAIVLANEGSANYNLLYSEEYLGTYYVVGINAQGLTSNPIAVPISPPTA
jgi:YVTN family beta-propeller protein